MQANIEESNIQLLEIKGIERFSQAFSTNKSIKPELVEIYQPNGNHENQATCKDICMSATRNCDQK